jgi:D-tyrosyl-tRNA(Tyr) deacylase
MNSSSLACKKSWNIYIFVAGLFDNQYKIKLIMRAVIQRVSEVSVTTDSKIISSIRVGLLVFLGIEDDDTLEDIKWLCKKIINLRIFNDENGIMNRSVAEIEGELMIVSQFTLHASTKKGNRPSYIKASKAENAVRLYEKFIQQIRVDSGLEIKTGRFGADMKVQLINDALSPFL